MDFKFKEEPLKYFTSNLNSKGYYDHTINAIGKYHTRISTVMGGNYGVGDSYLVKDDEGYHILTYFGDMSAHIKHISNDIDNEVKRFLDNQEKQYKAEAYHFKRYY
jgi:hypothetical protein